MKPPYPQKHPRILAGPTIPISTMSEADQRTRREELENGIRANVAEGVTAKVKIGKMLHEIGPAGKALYRWTHTDFYVYCTDTFGFKRSTTRLLLNDGVACATLEGNVKMGNKRLNDNLFLPILTDDTARHELAKHPVWQHKPILAKMEADKEPPTKEAIRRVAKAVKPPPPVVQKPKKIIDKKRRKIGQRVMHNLRMVYRGLQDAGLVGPFDKRLKELAKKIEAAFLEGAA